MFGWFLLSARQMSDRSILMVITKSLAVTTALFALLGLGLWLGARELVVRHIGTDWQGLAAVATLMLVLLSGWLLFRIVAVAVVGIFADDVVRAVEARHYPGALASARDVPLARSAAMGLGSAGRAILVNLALLPVYIVLLVTGVGTAVAFFVVNAWLLGRDLGDMVAARHLPADTLALWRKNHRTQRFVLGAAGTGLLLVPFVNLVAPVLAAAMATHLYHRRKM